MIKSELNNIDNPLPNETFTAAQAIQAVNRLLWSEDVEDDDMHDALLIKAFLVGTLPNIPAPVTHSKTIPVMETTIEGAQKRIKRIIQAETEGKETYLISDLEYIGVFLDSVGDEMAAMSTSYNSLHERHVQDLATIDELNAELDRRLATAEKLQEERDDLHARWLQACANEETLRQANINLIHAAHDNS